MLTLLLMSCTTQPQRAEAPGPEVSVQVAPAEGAMADPPPPFSQDIVLLAWIPYDNDLGRFVGPVLAGLRDGSEGGVEVAAQVDRPDHAGMERAIFRRGALEVEEVAEEDSGSIEAFGDFLQWAANRYEARAYAVVIMDHGGDLHRVSRDDDAGPGALESTWLDTAGIARELERFRGSEPGEVELLALQVCGKASIEPLRVVAPAARFTLASQLPLAAPNTWYRDALRAMADHPEWDGADWVRAIASSDEDRMYAAVTCVDNQALLAQEPLDYALHEGDLQAPGAPPTWQYSGETYVDLLALAHHLDRDPAPLEALSCGVFASMAPDPLLTVGFPDPLVLAGLSAALRPDEDGSIRVDPPPSHGDKPPLGASPVLPRGG